MDTCFTLFKSVLSDTKELLNLRVELSNFLFHNLNQVNYSVVIEEEEFNIHMDQRV